MGTLKQRTIDGILAAEGGYVNDPSDSGGETNFGITVAVARANGYQGDMADMSQKCAEAIYGRRYWDAVRGDDLAALSDSVAGEVVDTAVNMGVMRAGEFLQRSLNVLNKRGTLYPDIVVDGDIGSRTVAALFSYVALRDPHTLAKALNCLQGAYYIELSERREKDERFVYGWLKNRVVML